MFLAVLSPGRRGLPSHLAGRTTPSPWERPLPTLPLPILPISAHSWPSFSPSLSQCPHMSPATVAPTKPTLHRPAVGQVGGGEKTHRKTQNPLCRLCRGKAGCGNSCPGNARAHPALPSPGLGKTQQKSIRDTLVLPLLHSHPRQINEYFNKEIFH